MTVQAQEGWRTQLLARDQLMQWGALALSVLLLLGLIFMVALVLIPDVQQRADYIGFVAASRTELANTQQARELAPARLQDQITRSEQRLAAASAKFLGEAAATAAVNQLYVYAQATGVEIVNVQTANPAATDYYAQRDFQFQVTGELPNLLAFLGRIEHVAQSGFVVDAVALTPDAAQHKLALRISVFTSPYAIPASQELGLADLQVIPLGEVQEQLSEAWRARDWAQAILLLEPVMAVEAENATVRLALYRAHVNYGYQLLAARDEAGARAHFEAALGIYPAGTEAAAELKLAATNPQLANTTGNQLRQQLIMAKNAQNWADVIRLLRVIGAVDASYGPVEDELFQAYVAYGDQFMAQGHAALAEEQYQLAQTLRPDAVVPRAQPPAAPAPVVTPPVQTGQ